jgi:hypothetical protein
MRLGGHRRTRRQTAEMVMDYLTGPEFAADFAALDPERKRSALDAVRVALERLLPRPPAVPGVPPETWQHPGRVRWSESPEWQERIRDAARRLPDDKAIARELGISPNAAKVARWRYAGRRDKSHVADCRLGAPPVHEGRSGTCGT